MSISHLNWSTRGKMRNVLSNLEEKINIQSMMCLTKSMYIGFHHHRIVVNVLSRCCTRHEPKYVSGSDKQSQDLNSIDPLKKQENFKCSLFLSHFCNKLHFSSVIFLANRNSFNFEKCTFLTLINADENKRKYFLFLTIFTYLDSLT